MFKKILILFLFWKITLYAVVWISDPFIKDDNVFMPYKEQFFAPHQGNKLISHFANLDGINYIEVARKGYTKPDLGFFPLYPLLISTLSWIPHAFTGFHYYVLCAEIIANVSFLLSLWLLYKLMQVDHLENKYWFMVLCIALFPTSYYFVTAYNDSLFFLLALLTLYSSRKKYWFIASFCGMFATLTRLNGIALFPYILVEYFLQEHQIIQISFSKKYLLNLLTQLRKVFLSKNILTSGIFWSVLIPCGFILYLLFIQFTFGSYTLLFSSMKTWGQDRMVFPIQVVWRYIKILVIYPTFKLNYWIAFLELAAVCVYVFLSTISFNKIRLSYWVLMVISFLIPALTGTFQGMPRYGLHLYPFFLSYALALSPVNKKILIVYFFICAIVLIILLSLYSNGYFVA